MKYFWIFIGLLLVAAWVHDLHQCHKQGKAAIRGYDSFSGVTCIEK